MSTPGATGAVYDLGYRPYEGPRGGRRAARAALWRWSMRRAMGLRRDWRQKVFPWVLVAMATMPALVAVMAAFAASRSAFEDVELVSHREYLGISSILLLFVATVSPDLVCPDRRNRTLPLIFSRPLTGDDYVAAKLAAVASLVFGFTMAPQVVLFVGQMLVAPDGTADYVQDNLGALWQVPVGAALLAIFYAAFSLAVAATTSRRVAGSVAILAIIVVTGTVAAVGGNADSDDGSGSFGSTDTQVTIDLDDIDDLEDLEELERQFEDLEEPARSDGSAWALADISATPGYLIDVVFLGEAADDSPIAGVQGGSAAALGVYVAVVGVSLAFLHRRYRTVDL